MRKLKLITARRFGIFVSILTLVISQAGNHTPTYPTKRENVNKYKLNTISTFKLFQNYRKTSKQYIIRTETKPKKKSQTFTITAYDLSVRCTGKSRGDKGFGITTDGTNLKNTTWREVRVISTDPHVIPLGTRVFIKFNDEKYKRFDGIYISSDTGSAIKGLKVDLFLADFHSSKVNQKTINFGTTTANVTILKN